MIEQIKQHYKHISLVIISSIIIILTAFNIQLAIVSGTTIETLPFFAFEVILSIFSLLYLGIVTSKVWNMKMLLHFLVVFSLYIVGSYILEWSLNVNVKKYNIWYFTANHFWQLNFILYILLVVLVATVYNYVKKVQFRFIEERLASQSKARFYFSSLLISLATLGMGLTDSKVFPLLPQSSFLTDYIEKDQFKINANSLLYLDSILFYLILIFLPIAFLAVVGIREIYKNKPRFSAAILVSTISSIIFNYTIQFSIRGDVMVLEKHLFSGATMFQIAVFFILFLFIYLITNEFLLGTILVISLGIVMTIANSLKFQFRQEPILPSDISWLRHPETLLEFVGGNAFLYTFLAIALIVLIYWFGRKKILYGQLLSSQWMQLAGVILSVLFFVGIYGTFTHKQEGKINEKIPFLGILNNFYDMTWNGNTANAQIRSLSFVWFSQLASNIMEKPVDYSENRIKEIEEKYQKKANELNQSRKQQISDQTVVYVLSESFADPARIPSVTITENPIPNIQEIKENTTSGLMKSDGYGGGTANMEFQTLTSLPFYNLSPSISVLYTQVEPNMNRLPSVSNLFDSKNRIAIHIANATNYARNVVYKDLKFAKFINDKTKNIGGYNIGAYYSDASTYDQVIANIDNQSGQFFSVMTMQNHMPWSETNPSEISASSPLLSDDENKSLSSYVRLLRRTDIATQEFLDSLSKIDKKVTVVFYGDHLPGLYPQSAFETNPENQYLTDYFIWSNYETPKLDYPKVNSSDFTALLLEQTNSKVSSYYALMTEVLHKASVDKENLDEEGKQIAEDLKLIEYDIVSGKGYLKNSFFALPK